MALAPPSSAPCSLRIDEEEGASWKAQPTRSGLGTCARSAGSLWNGSTSAELLRTTRAHPAARSKVLRGLPIASGGRPPTRASDDQPLVHLRLTREGADRRHPSREAVVLRGGLHDSTLDLQPVAAVLLAPRTPRGSQAGCLTHSTLGSGPRGPGMDPRSTTGRGTGYVGGMNGLAFVRGSAPAHRLSWARTSTRSPRGCTASHRTSSFGTPLEWYASTLGAEEHAFGG
jgi:hypothetical protein